MLAFAKLALVGFSALFTAAAVLPPVNTCRMQRIYAGE